MIADWDDAYANTPHIPDGEAWPARWSAWAAAFRAGLPADRRREGLAYGPHPRERVDLFLPEGRPKGLFVFVHGGFWRAFDRTDWSHAAAGPLARGWAVALPSYPLVPEVRIAAITRSIAAAIESAAATVAGPVCLAGHSAGGHLVARQACDDSTLAPATRGRIALVTSISGLHDLRPLLRLKLNADFRLDPAEAAAESPALRAPLPGIRIRTRVGGAERPEFVRQSALLANIWTGLGADIADTVDPDLHHFNVVGPLAEPGSDFVAAVLGEAG